VNVWLWLISPSTISAILKVLVLILALLQLEFCLENVLDFNCSGIPSIQQAVWSGESVRRMFGICCYLHHSNCFSCSTGVPNRIQVSQATAELLKEAGKGSWIAPRTDAVHSKGKGVLTTYWLLPSSSGAESVSSPLVAPSNADVKQTRLIKWMVDLFLDHVNKIYASRNFKLPKKPVNPKQNSITMDEVVEVICLPKFDAKSGQEVEVPEQMKISSCAIDQLYDYVSNIASLYFKNPFHNCE
jgi:hypothetical protein